MPSDPYKVLGVSASASDAEVRSAYRKLVQLHHPDHNNGSVQSARKFEQVQEAYGQVVAMRKGGSDWAPRRPASTPPPPPPVDSDLEARLAEIERKLREANARHAKARRDAREAAAAAASGRKRPSDEELGYFSTDDTLSKILADARAEFSDRVGEVRGHPVTKRVADLLDELAAKLTGEKPEP